MKYEILSLEKKDYKATNSYNNILCPGLFLCTLGNKCEPIGDNLCINPGLGCRNGCGGAKTSSCVGTNNF